jgi:hypothetical protein
VTGPEDIASLFSGTPAGPSQEVRYRQGVIVSWNPATLENVVEVGGAQLTNLPVLGVAEAATFAPGDVVGLVVIGDRGVRTLAIIGQLVIPNSPEALSALSFLSVRTYADNVVDFGTTTSGSYTNLDAPSPVGPVIPDVLVGPSGRVLVTVGCFVTVEEGTLSMTAELSGANIIVANDANVWHVGGLSGGTTTFEGMGCMRYLLEGLNSGFTTFTAKYRVQGPPASAVVVTDRSMVVEVL